MGIFVRVNRDHVRHRWTVHSLTHGTRLGHAIGLLLKDVRFTQEGPSGWAEGELVSWADIQLDPKFHERLEARTVDRLGLTFWPLEFREGEFFVLGAKVLRCSWLRILGREAECAESRAV